MTDSTNSMRRRIRGLPRNVVEASVGLAILNALRERGWQQSVVQRAPVDAEGSPIPWLTYPFIDWLDTRLRPDDRILEFGAGNSTPWFADRCARVVSVEHDSEWASRVSATVGANVEVREAEDAPTRYPSALRDGPWNIVLIDAIHRNECLGAVEPTDLAEDGLVILDDSHRRQYAESIRAMSARGFGRIDFTGFAPGLGTEKTTSVFARTWGRWLNAAHDVPTMRW